MSGALLAICGACKIFGALCAVSDISLTASAGEIIGLIGPSGSGKTTVLNLICGLIRPDRGAIHFDGRDVTGLPAHALARAGIARTFQLVRVIGQMTALEHVMAGVIVREGVAWHSGAEDEAAALLKRVGLGGRERQAAADLPHSDQKRIELARALALKPRLLLLDAWLTGLSASERHGGIALIRSLASDDIAIVIVEQPMSAITPLCPRALVMNAGMLIADGPTAQVMSDPAVARLCPVGDASA